MKILNLITAIIIIGYIFSQSELSIHDIILGENQEINFDDYPDKKLPPETPLIFGFQKDIKPIYIHLSLPLEVKTEDISLIYYDFKKTPSEQDILSRMETREFYIIDLYDKVEYEGVGNEYTYRLQTDIDTSYILLLFTTSSSDITSFSILVESYEKDKDDGEGDGYFNKIYDVNYSTFYDIELEEKEGYYVCALNSTQENTGEQIMNLIVQHGSNLNIMVNGYMLKTGKIEEIYKANELHIEQIKLIEEETNDTYQYSFNLNEENKYFFIIIHSPTPIDNSITVYFNEKKDEETKTNFYYVNFTTEYQIDEEYLVPIEGFSFHLLSTEPHSGGIFILFKTKKDFSRRHFVVGGYGKRNLLDKNEEGVNINVIERGTLYGEEYDKHIFYFKLDEELNFLIGVKLENSLDYLSVYLSEKNGHVFNLSLENEYVIDKKEFPQEIIPENEQFFFRMKNDGKEKILQLRTDLGEGAMFGVFTIDFDEYPSDEEIYNWDSSFSKVELVQKTSNNVNDIFIYYFTIPESMPYFSIIVFPMKKLNSLSVYVKNNDEEEDMPTYYQFEYAYHNRINITKIREKIILLPEETDNHGKYLLNFVASKTDNVAFEFFGVQFEDEDKIDMDEPNKISFDFIDSYDIENSTKTVFRYSFTLDEGYKYYLVGVQPNEVVDYFSYYFDIPKKQYNITYSTEYQIEKKYLVHSSNFYNTFLSVDPHIGDNYIKLKVKKGVKEDSFYLGGYGSSEYDNENGDKIALHVKYDDVFPGDEYDILQYYFKSNESSSYFHINMIIQKPVDYLNITLDDKSEKKESDSDEPKGEGEEEGEGKGKGEEKSNQSDKSESGSSISPVVLAIIIIVPVLVLLVVVYFVIRKCGFLKKTDVTSKDIENVDQIIA